MRVKKLQAAIDHFKEELGSALLSANVWEKESGLSLVTYNPNEKYTAIFSRLTNDLENALDDLGLPPFGGYQLTDLQMDTLLLLINLDGKYYCGNIIDKSKITLGFLINVSIPNFQKEMKAALKG